MTYHLRLKGGTITREGYGSLSSAEEAALEQGAISIVMVHDVRTYPRLLTEDQRAVIFSDYVEIDPDENPEMFGVEDYLKSLPDSLFITEGLLCGALEWQDEFRAKIEESCRSFPEVVEPLVNAVRSLLTPSDVPC